MIRGGSSSDSIDHSLGLGPHLVGKSIDIHGRNLEICKQLGEGGFSFVYLVRSTNSNSSIEHEHAAAAATNNINTNSTPASMSSNHNHSGSSSSSSQQQQNQQTKTTSLTDSGNRRQTNPTPRPPLIGGSGSSSSGSGSNNSNNNTPMVLKITSVHNNAQRLMAEKEAKLLQMLSHPSIIQIYDHGFREEAQATTSTSGGGGSDAPHQLAQHVVMDNEAVASHGNNNTNDASSNTSTKINTNNSQMMMKSAQHLILMEYCEGGTAFDAIKRMRLSSMTSPASSNTSLTPTRGLSTNSTTTTTSTSQRFDLPSLVISFGQICNAVSYLHAQRPPIIHRDLKPVNFLIKKGGAYKLCDFGSAVIGHTDLRTPENRRKAEEIVNKTTTQMFRAPEMVDLYMSKRLTQSTDVWALGCCLYSLAYLRDCFEEGSNLAILSRKYKIPEDNPYGDGLVDLIDRMLALDCKERADMSEVIMCLSALYSNRPLPQRKYATKTREEMTTVRMGAYRTDGQGIRHEKDPVKNWKMGEAKKLDPNSAAAKRKKASEGHKQYNNISSSISSNNKDNIMSSVEIISEHGGEGGQQQNNTTKSSSPPSLAEDSFHNFASFERVFDNQSIDHQFHDNMNTDESATTSLLDDTFNSTFEEQCQISTAPSSSSPPPPSAATVGDGKNDNGYAAEDTNFEVMFHENLATSSSSLEILPSPTNYQLSPSRRGWNVSSNAPGSFPQLLSSTATSGGADSMNNEASNSNTKKKRGLFGSIRGKK
ncbi:hypothetical protein ACHAWU_007369 [Discostella pseudostelligera]|uniref:non-specific serine/threonine protein kinase n=1 Tax=Discostella pseudostelligera TaxID=259834 RepID=A0ABD3MBC8_9STRA